MIDDLIKEVLFEEGPLTLSELIDSSQTRDESVRLNDIESEAWYLTSIGVLNYYNENFHLPRQPAPLREGPEVEYNCMGCKYLNYNPEINKYDIPFCKKLEKVCDRTYNCSRVIPLDDCPYLKIRTK